MNIHASHLGVRVQVVAETTQRALTADFPGYGKGIDLEPFYRPIVVGMTGVITSVESHGMNPWTRYSIKFDNGTRTSGFDPAKVQFIPTTTECPACGLYFEHYDPTVEYCPTCN